MATLTRKLTASSLVEVTVGMVLISIAIGFALMIYLNVSASAPTLQSLKYQLALRAIARETEQQRVFLNQTWQEESVTIHKVVRPYPEASGTWLIELEATGADQRTLATYQTIVYAPSH